MVPRLRASISAGNASNPTSFTLPASFRCSSTLALPTDPGPHALNMPTIFGFAVSISSVTAMPLTSSHSLKQSGDDLDVLMLGHLLLEAVLAHRGSRGPGDDRHQPDLTLVTDQFGKSVSSLARACNVVGRNER